MNTRWNSVGNVVKTCGSVKLLRIKGIDLPDIKENLWRVYDSIFWVINSQTPIMQSYHQTDFQEFLRRDDVVKIVAVDDDEVVAIGMIFSDLSLDPWLSKQYFLSHFDGPVYYIPTLAVAESARNSRVGIEVLRLLINEVPSHGFGVFDYSEIVNPLIPRLADLAGRGRITGRIIDKKVMAVYEWVGGTHVCL